MYKLRIVETMYGLGDNIYSRPFISDFVEQNRRFGISTAIKTPWPQLYEDLNCCTMPVQTNLRTQRKNVEASNFNIPKIGSQVIDRTKIGYDMKLPIVKSLESRMPLVGQFKFELPKFRPIFTPEKPIILTKPLTVREEWSAPARNPLNQYLLDCIDQLRRDYIIVSIADIDPPHEIGLEPFPFAHVKFHAGELNVREILGLVRSAAGMVSAVGWAVPASMAYKIPNFVILGGAGGYNQPEILDDPRIKHKISWATPDKFCLCRDLKHNCDKKISNLDKLFGDWRAKHSI
jgi:hypothetical protein